MVRASHGWSIATLTAGGLLETHKCLRRHRDADKYIYIYIYICICIYQGSALIDNSVGACLYSYMRESLVTDEAKPHDFEFGVP